MTFITTSVVLAAVVIIGILATGLRRPSDRQLQLFARMYSVPLTESTVPLLRSQILRGRRFRFLGIVLGLVFLALSSVSGQRMGWGPLVLGYGLGAVVGQLTMPRTKGQRARLERRQITDFIRPWVFGLIGTNLVVAAAIVLRTAIDKSPASNGITPPDGFLGTSFGWGALALFLLFILSALTAKPIVDQPAPSVAPDADAALHGLRSASLMSLAGVLLMTASALVTSVDIWAASASPLNAGASLGASLFSGFAAVAGFFLTIRALPRWTMSAKDLPKMPDMPAGPTPSSSTAPSHFNDNTGMNGAPA